MKHIAFVAPSRRFQQHQRRIKTLVSLEFLEDRTLLDAAALSTLAEYDLLAQKTESLDKISPTLTSIYMQGLVSSSQTDSYDLEINESLAQVTTDGYVVIDAVASSDAEQLLGDLENLGLRNGSYYGLIVSGQIPIDALDDMSSLESLQYARPYMALTSVGSTTSQGDKAMLADRARSTFDDVDGSGITIGILSDSFNTSGYGSYSQDISSGDLPGPGNPNGYTTSVNVIQDFNGGFFNPTIDEGRGMAQLIHDVAPAANLAFHTAYSGQADFANGIVRLANAGAEIIVDDIIYFAEPMFQDGIVAQAVDQVVNQGVAYFSAAGNDAHNSYETNYVHSGINLQSTLGFNAEAHDFNTGTGTDVFQRITLPGGGATTYFVLQWEDPFYSVSGGTGAVSDLDIILFRNGSALAGGVEYNLRSLGGSGDPVEVFSYTNFGSTGAFDIAITKFAGPNPARIKYVAFASNGFVINEYDTASSTSYGHANAAGAMAVGAAFYADTPAYGRNPPLLESFSARGGVPILFDTAGNHLPSPVIRQTPDIVAPDGTNTSFFPAFAIGGQDVDGDGFPNFFGTSAAAPHAAAVAALLMDANPSLIGNPTAIYNVLQNTAIDMGISGVDFDTGYGFVNAYAAVESVVQPPAQRTDVAITSITANPAELNQGDRTVITVTIQNVGNQNVTSSFDVTLTDTTTNTLIGKQTVTLPPLDPLAPGEQVILQFTWNTSEASFGVHVLRAEHSLEDGDPANNTRNVNVTVKDPSTPPPTVFYFSLQYNGTVGGLTVGNEDIVAFDGTTYSLFFDGSDVGLRGSSSEGFTIDAFDVISPTVILMSFAEPGYIEAPGANHLFVDDSDIVMFNVTQLGSTTIGTFTIYFDGSAHGLGRDGSRGDAEDIDSVTLLADDSLLVSVNGSASVPGISNTVQDEDIIRYRPSGTWELFFDGTSAGLDGSAENIDGFTIKDGKYYITTSGSPTVPGISGTVLDDDVFVYNPATGTYEPDLYFNGPDGNDVKGIDFPGTASSGGQGQTNGVFDGPGFAAPGNPDAFSIFAAPVVADPVLLAAPESFGNTGPGPINSADFINLPSTGTVSLGFLNSFFARQSTQTAGAAGTNEVEADGQVAASSLSTGGGGSGEVAFPFEESQDQNLEGRNAVRPEATPANPGSERQRTLGNMPGPAQRANTSEARRLSNVDVDFALDAFFAKGEEINPLDSPLQKEIEAFTCCGDPLATAAVLAAFLGGVWSSAPTRETRERKNQPSLN